MSTCKLCGGHYPSRTIDDGTCGMHHKIGVHRAHISVPVLDDTDEVAALKKERAAVVALLRWECGKDGDNDWPDELHLADVIERHLLNYL